MRTHCTGQLCLSEAWLARCHWAKYTGVALEVFACEELGCTQEIPEDPRAVCKAICTRCLGLVSLNDRRRGCPWKLTWISLVLHHIHSGRWGMSRRSDSLMLLLVLMTSHVNDQDIRFVALNGGDDKTSTRRMCWKGIEGD